ncbi:MAG: hypothetical protein JNK69_05220 [Saprospiraceae bacterium]|nr:hypothetical protein [Candidatus Vicinibacter proximus]MBL7822785.1 hypothetical protein [Saprospiraceae bacterium]MCC6843232.1 hypothetical protein [Saprospiraceae bacterium]HRG33014.1 hypothetical protein [Saprospiraceae bacterium]
MKRTLIIYNLLLLITANILSGQVLVNSLIILTPDLHEISGLITLDRGQHYYAINDGGNEAVIYQLDSVGRVERKVSVVNAINRDWEELTTDGKEYLYIADTGNNKQKRQRVVIYRIRLVDLIGDNAVQADSIEIIYQQYPDKKPKGKDRKFDVEAMCWMKDKIYFFTKNWMQDIPLKTDLYTLYPNPGIHTLSPEKSIAYSGRFFMESQLTGSCFDQESNNIYWLTETQIIQTDAPSFKRKKMVTYDLPELGQWESICPLGNSRFAVARERNKVFGQEAALMILSLKSQD